MTACTRPVQAQARQNPAGESTYYASVGTRVQVLSTHIQKEGVVTCVCNPRTAERQRQKDGQATSLASGSVREPHLRGIEKRLTGPDIQRPSLPSAHVQGCACLHEETPTTHAQLHITQKKNNNFQRKKWSKRDSFSLSWAILWLHTNRSALGGSCGVRGLVTMKHT